MYTNEQYRNHIRELQHYLRTLSLTDDRYPLIAVDGIFGSETTNAVKMFQQLNGITVTGTVDRASWERLLREYNQALLLVAATESISPFPYPGFVLKAGDKCPFVYILQIMLNEITAAFGSYVPLAVTGTYDPATVERVIALKCLADYPATAELDRTFWDYLAVWYNRGRDAV